MSHDENMFTFWLILTVIIILLCFTTKAKANRYDVITIPPVKCGPQCVIETYRFDDKKEAEEFATRNNTIIQNYPNKNMWFVEVHMTEATANLM